MTIEGDRPTNPSHEENVFYRVRCYSCPSVSLEDGSLFDPPDILADINDNLTYERALEIALKHETEHGVDHELLLSYIDFGCTRDILSGKE